MFSVHNRAKELGQGSEAPAADYPGDVSVPGRGRSDSGTGHALPQHVADIPPVATRET